MNKLTKILIVFVMIVGGAFFVASFFFSGINISDEQQETIDLLGYPDHFSITYLPQGSEDNLMLARSEAWFYLSMGKKMNFLAGRLLSVEELVDIEKLPSSTTLKPEKFRAKLNLLDIEKLLGNGIIKEVDYVPGFNDESIKTYMSDKAIFMIEDNYLAYIQTFGIVE